MNPVTTTAAQATRKSLICGHEVEMLLMTPRLGFRILGIGLGFNASFTRTAPRVGFHASGAP